MERYIFLGVLLFTLVALGLGMLLPSKSTEGPVYLPWQIEKTASGSTRVFGLEPGSSTLAEVQQRFREVYKVNMFVREDGEKVVEVYFDSITLSGLRARVILVMDLTPEQLSGFYERGERIATMSSNRDTRKVTLTDSDLQSLAAMPFASLTYLPKSNLNAELVEARFGQPAERIREKGTEEIVEHWLYPQLGLDLALHEKGKEVLQYVQPSRFESVRKPLIENGELLSN